MCDREHGRVILYQVCLSASVFKFLVTLEEDPARSMIRWSTFDEYGIADEASLLRSDGMPQVQIVIRDLVFGGFCHERIQISLKLLAEIFQTRVKLCRVASTGRGDYRNYLGESSTMMGFSVLERYSDDKYLPENTRDILHCAT